MLFFVRLKGALGDSPAAVAVPLMVVRVGVLSFASERLCLSWHGSSIECVFRQPPQTATCRCAHDFSLIPTAQREPRPSEGTSIGHAGVQWTSS